MANSPNDLLQGTLELLILQTLSRGSEHGWGVAQLIQQRSRDLLSIQQGSLYPALHRLEEQGYLDSSWGTSEHNRRAKFYHLTPDGRQQLQQQTHSWIQFAKAVHLILQPA